MSTGNVRAAKVCANSGVTLVDSDGNVLVECIRAGRGWDTGFQEYWILADKFAGDVDNMDHWDSIKRYRVGDVLPIYMTY